MPRVDQVTADQVRQVLLSAKARGADPATALDQAGLVDHPGKRRELRIDVIEALIYSTRGAPADHIIGGRMPRTLLDIKQEVIRYLEHVREGMIRNGAEK